MQGVLIGLVVFAAGCFVCVFSLVLVLACLVLLFATGQAMELFDRTVYEAQRASRGYLIHEAMLLWLAVTWYASRLVMERPLDRRLALWAPRVLGIFIYLPLARHVLDNRETWQTLAVGAIAAVWLACMVSWRRWADARSASEDARTALGTATVVAALVALSTLHAILIALLLPDAALPRFLSAPQVLLAFASWMLVGSLVYTLLPKSYRPV